MLNCLKKKEKKNDDIDLVIVLDKTRIEIDNLDRKTEKFLYNRFKQKYVKELENLKYAIDNTSIKLLNETKKLEDLCNETQNLSGYLENVKEEFLEKCRKNSNTICCICMENIVNLVLVPCGHVMCSNCFKSYNIECYKCRNRIVSCQKVYLD